MLIYAHQQHKSIQAPQALPRLSRRLRRITQAFQPINTAPCAILAGSRGWVLGAIADPGAHDAHHHHSRHDADERGQHTLMLQHELVALLCSYGAISICIYCGCWDRADDLHLGRCCFCCLLRREPTHAASNTCHDHPQHDQQEQHQIQHWYEISTHVNI